MKNLQYVNKEITYIKNKRYQMKKYMIWKMIYQMFYHPLIKIQYYKIKNQYLNQKQLNMNHNKLDNNMNKVIKY